VTRLLTAAKTKDEMEGRLLLDVVVRKGPPVFELLPREDEALLIRRDTLLVLDLRLHIVNGVRGLHFQSDRLASQRLHEDLHTTTETKDQVEGGLLLDVIIRKGPAILELLSGKDEALLVRGDAFLVLDFALDVVDRVGGLHLEGDGLAGQGLDEDLHTTAETEDEVKGRLLLDVVIRESAPILELLAGEDKTLLVRRNTLLVLDLRLDVINRVRGLDLERDGLSSPRRSSVIKRCGPSEGYEQGLNEDLHGC